MLKHGLSLNVGATLLVKKKSFLKNKQEKSRCQNKISFVTFRIKNLFAGHLVRGKGAILRHKITDTVSPENVRDVWNQLTDMSQATRLNSIEVMT